MNIQKQRQIRRQKGWIRLRYLFPILAILLILVAMRIPCLQYTTADTGTNDTISAWELMGNAFDQSRTVLFGSEEQTQTNVAFSRSVLTVWCVCLLLFLIGCAVAVWSLVTALRYFQDPKAHVTARIAFITAVPNRIALCLWLLCLLPLPAFPRLLVMIYHTMLHYAVVLDVTFAEPLLIAALLLLAEILLSILTASAERKLGMDPFQRMKSPSPSEEETSDSGEDVPEELSPEQREYYDRMRKTREEQIAQIRQMLNDKDE